MKLLPEQVVQLNESLEKLQNTYKRLREMKRNDVVNANYAADGFTDLPDSQLISEINETINKIHEIELILKTCTIIDNVPSEIIAIGSEFTATVDFFGEKEPETYVLVENGQKIAGKKIISIASPLGQSVLGKTVNDNFSYKVNNNVFNGTINKIHTCPLKEKTIVK